MGYNLCDRLRRNPANIIYCELLDDPSVLLLSAWLNDLWLLVTLVPAIAFIAVAVISRGERFQFEHRLSG